MPNTHYRSTRILHHPIRIAGGVFVVLFVSTMSILQIGSATRRPTVVSAAPHGIHSVHHSVPHTHRTKRVTAVTPAQPPVRMYIATAAVVTNATPPTSYVVSLIKKSFPPTAWHSAEVVAWCESKFHPLDIHFDSNGTHDRGLFQLNDGGTEQFLLQQLGLNPNNVNLAFNPVLNVKAAALLYARDGWSQWTCASAL